MVNPTNNFGKRTTYDDMIEIQSKRIPKDQVRARAFQSLKPVNPRVLTQLIRSEKLQSYHAEMLKFSMTSEDQNIFNIYSLVFTKLNVFELAGMMPVCKSFFVIAREFITPQIPALIAESEELKKDLHKLPKIRFACH